MDSKDDIEHHRANLSSYPKEETVDQAKVPGMHARRPTGYCFSDGRQKGAQTIQSELAKSKATNFKQFLAGLPFTGSLSVGDMKLKVAQ